MNENKNVKSLLTITMLVIFMTNLSAIDFSFITIERASIPFDTIPKKVKSSNQLLGAPTLPPGPPKILDIPIQYAQIGDTFATLNLADYLYNIDSADVAWSYRFSHELYNAETINWNGNFNSFGQGMTMTVQMDVRDTFPNASGHKLAAFHHEELRGVATASLAGSKYLFYLTIFSNQALDSIHFKYYHKDQATVFAVEDTVLFISEQIIGHVDNPYVMKAGYLTMDLQSGSTLHPRIIDTEWLGSDTVYVMAKGLNTQNGFADTAMVVFLIGTEPSLPVELISFTGEKIERTSFLEWRIAQPENVRGYEIHRGTKSYISGNLIWEMIGFVEQSDDLFFYRFLDNEPELAKNYYRLKMVDLDSSYEWSNTIILDFESARNYAVKFFPNPSFMNIIFLEITTEVPELVDVIIYDIVGRIIFSIRMDSDGQMQRLSIDLEWFEPGMYIAKFNIGSRVLNSTFIVGGS